MELLHLSSDPILRVAIEECHEQIHNEEDAEEKVYHKEDCEDTTVLVGGEHDVGAVGSCQQHQHIET